MFKGITGVAVSNPEELEKLLHGHDLDGDGVLSASEYMLMIVNVEAYH